MWQPQLNLLVTFFYFPSMITKRGIWVLIKKRHSFDFQSCRLKVQDFMIILRKAQVAPADLKLAV